MADAPTSARTPIGDPWPALPLAEWRETYATLHMWTQIVGKTCLAFAEPQNHWWHVALQVTCRGLTTCPLRAGPVAFDVAFDFLDHHLVVRTSNGAILSLPLVPQSVAEFYRHYLTMLAELGIAAKLHPVPVEVERAIPFPDDREHAAYDPMHAHRFWRILAHADHVFRRFRARFLGKSSPVHFFWGSFDLACTRFSGRVAPRHPGGVPNCPDYVMHEAYSHECASCGFWPGGGVIAEPAFFAYAYPAPPGYADVTIEPPAYFSRQLGEFVLPYEAVRTTTRPEEAILGFLQRTYEAAAELGQWDRRALERGTHVPG